MRPAVVSPITAAILFIVISSAAFADDLAKQSQNPLGTIISLPLENNFYTGIGPSESSMYALNMKPAYPVSLGDWNLINRFILPAIYTEGQDVPVPPGTDSSGSVRMSKLVRGALAASAHQSDGLRP